MSTQADTLFIQARLAEGLPVIGVSEAGGLPDEIQWMPPGRHTITPYIDGKPKEMTITVDAGLAERISQQLAALRAAADRGEGDVPFLDFNHEDGAASAEVTGLRWAGDDPKSGGIRARVHWTKAGRDALEGKNFRRFSPQWLSDPKSLEPVGVGVNLGGLVNRAAFTRIQPVVAKNGVAQPLNQPMTEQDKQDLLQLITLATKPIAERVQALEAKAGEAQAGFETRIKAIEARNAEGVLIAARAKVAGWAAEGKLPPQDKDRLEAVAKAIAADPALETTFASLAPNPAFKTVTGGSGSGGDPGAIDTFPKAIEAEVKAGAKSKAEAFDRAHAKYPELHLAWAKAGGGKI
jgi:phage I-like protein